MFDNPGHLKFKTEVLNCLSQYPESIVCNVISVKKGEFNSAFEKGLITEDL